MQAVVYVGDNLKKARLYRAMTQRQLADAAGVSHRTIVELEANRTEPHPSTIAKLSKALGVEPRELIGDLP